MTKNMLQYKTRNAEPNNVDLPQPIRELDKEMSDIGFTIDLGSYKVGEDLNGAIDLFVDVYGSN